MRPFQLKADERPPSRPEVRVDLRVSPSLALPTLNHGRLVPLALLTHTPVEDHADGVVSLKGARERRVEVVPVAGDDEECRQHCL